MATLLIRDAGERDQEAIRSVTLAAYAEYATQMEALHWELYRASILFALENERAAAEQMVAEHDGALIGTVLLYPPRRFALPDGTSMAMPVPEVRLLAVAPAGRGHGVGEALMQECLRRARVTGATGLALHTTAMMQAAMRMYARLGFARAPQFDMHPVPELTIEGYLLDFGAAGLERRP